MPALNVSVALGLCGVLLWACVKAARRAVSIPSVASKWPVLGTLQSVTQGKKLLFEVYQKQLNDPQPYSLPGLFGDSVVLPPSMLPWLVAQPENDLSAKWAQLDALNIPTTFLRAEIGINPAHEPLVRRDLTAHLDAVEADMWDEIGHALEDVWHGGNDDWHEVDLDETIRRVVARASNRIFVGPELCRNNDFIENAITYATRVSTYGLMLSLLPRFILRPLAGALARLPITASYEPCAKYLVPMFEDFVSRHDSKSKDGKDDKLPPNLFASWLVSSAASRFPPTSPERTPDFMSRRTMALNFAAVHTSTLTTCDLLLDVFSGSPKASEALREEALATLETWGPTECRRARLNGMTRLDSALRESMRLWGVAPRVLRRRVMKPGGVSLPDPGNGSGSLHVAEGTMVCISGWGIHHDERVYPQPFNYEYDRFMRSTGDKAADEEGKKTAGAAAVETDSEFTAWGIGKHACPGRYFAVDFVKMIMSHILVDYEVALLPERPANIWIEYNIVPPPGTRLSVRKRKAPTA